MSLATSTHGKLAPYSWGRLRAVQPGALFSGLYAWLATVALPLFQPGSPLASEIAAGAAPWFLVGGVLLRHRSPAVGRLLGIWGFVGACVVAWISGRAQLDVSLLPPWRSALGAAAWALFAFGWGLVRKLDKVPEEDPHALVDSQLAPRGRISRISLGIFFTACAMAVVPAVVAWEVSRREHAMLAHSVALASAVALITAGARIATDRGQWQPQSSQRRRLELASAPLTAAFVLSVIGVLLSLI